MTEPTDIKVEKFDEYLFGRLSGIVEEIKGIATSQYYIKENLNRG